MSITVFAQARLPTQAKMIENPKDFQALLRHVTKSEHPLRNMVAVYLSFFAGLRACEIAGLRWDKHVLDITGRVKDDLTITDDIAKSSSGRHIPMAPDLKRMLTQLHALRPDDIYVFHPVIGAAERVTASAVRHFFRRLYIDLGWEGASSHSGRRTFITLRARQANLVGCSLKDVQEWAGHRNLGTTQRYIDSASTAIQTKFAALPLYHGAAA